MGTNTKISWTHDTFNPWIGCTMVSAGCANCYAAEQNKLRKWVGAGQWNGERRRTSESNWKEPLKWNKAATERRRVFCASLADWLDDEVPVEWLADLLDLIRVTPNLDWLLLTKRLENWEMRLRKVFGLLQSRTVDHLDDPLWHWLDQWVPWNGQKRGAPANIWMGTTVENQEMAELRIPQLLAIPARVRFLSVEPMIGPVTLDPFAKHGRDHTDEGYSHLDIDWVICGGESGPKRRPFDSEWAQMLAEECSEYCVPFFMKQDSALRSGEQGRLSDALFNTKEFPA